MRTRTIRGLLEAGRLDVRLRWSETPEAVPISAVTR